MENTNINNFIEVSVISELIQNIDQIEQKCKTVKGEDAVELRVKQLAYSKLLVNVYGKDVTFLIKSSTQLGLAYIDIGYYEQAQEHLLNAFKLNENVSQDLNLSSKEYQIKILINLAKCYLENNKISPALSITEKSLKMNQTIFGEDHVSNADIYYVLAKINTKMKNYKIAIDQLTKMYNIYEKIEGYDSEKTAKICMELGQIYELSENVNDAIEYYKNSYTIWEKVVKDDEYEVLFTLATKLAELHEKNESYQSSYEILKSTENKYGDYLLQKKKKRTNYKKLIIKYTSLNQDIHTYLDELLELERILMEYNGEFSKGLAKTCISIATAYYQLEKATESLEYFEKAERIFTVFGNNKIAQDIKKKKEQLLFNK